MKNKPARSSADTQARILAAAARIFARNGLARATTRSIAEEAGVNEVTIFRHFKTKERLLAAVVGDNFGALAQAEAFVPPPPTADLRADLLGLAHDYDRLLTANLPLVRTMLGEIQHHHKDHEREVFRAVFRPIKSALTGRLETAKLAGELRPESRPGVLTDLFSGMVFTGVLRRGVRDFKAEYSSDDYLAAAVDLLLLGARPAARDSHK